MKLKNINPFKTAFILSLCFTVQTSFSQQLGNGYEPAITDFNQPLLSGAYAGNVPAGATPDASHQWTHLFTIRHNNPFNNHQLQIAASYSGNDRLFFRKVQATGATSQPWFEVATRGGNDFLGNQNITGVVKGTNEIISTMAGGYAQFRAVNGSYGLLLRNDGTNSYFLLTASGDAYGIWKDPLRPFMINNATGDVNIAAGALTVNHATGKVAIGLVNFTKTNEPNFKLFVAGGIMTEKVKVMNYANWADYVFTKEYKLTPLKEVEKFIIENKHLADIPSAKEIEDGGLDLADLSRLQMQKIEELTLYLIEHNKQISEQNKKINDLQKEIIQLKSK
jgi:hypothetical protein